MKTMTETPTDGLDTTVGDLPPPTRDPLLTLLGERLRGQRARRAMTRKALAEAASVSQRHLANLESGTGNVSILVLRDIAKALECDMPALLSPLREPSAERLLVDDLLSGRTDGELKRVRHALRGLLDLSATDRGRPTRVALIGLRGGGKTTLGQLLAQRLGFAFVEINREIERMAGCSVAEIHSLYGVGAYRRYERRALEEAIQIYPDVVIATPGGLVSDPANFNLLLSHCLSVWLQATPEEHMSRVVAQGDLRPMSGNTEAMQDLRQILKAREPFYAKADVCFDTSGKTVAQCFEGLHATLGPILALSRAPSRMEAW